MASWRSLFVAFGVAVLLGVALSTASLVSAPPVYTTVGREVRDPSGRPFLMYGFSRPSLEWDASGVQLSQRDVSLMASWGANTVRIPTNQDFLLPDSCHASPGYLDTLDALVGWINAAGMNAMIDLHWSDRDDPCRATMGQQLMADKRSLAFWHTLAAHYKEKPHVFFDLYNEPHGISWDCWLNGCVTGEGWRAVGMQQLYDTVRAAGFRNLVVVGGLDWARDLSGVPNHPLRGYGIVYATHPYEPDVDSAVLHHDFGALAGQYPIIAGEFGPFRGSTPFCSPAVMAGLIGYFDAPDGIRAQRIGWLSWAWYAADNVCTFPSDISDWTGAPSPNGVPVKAALARYVAESKGKE